MQKKAFFFFRIKQMYLPIQLDLSRQVNVTDTQKSLVLIKKSILCFVLWIGLHCIKETR